VVRGLEPAAEITLFFGRYAWDGQEMTVAIRQQLETDLRVALKARDRSRISVLRSTLSAVANAEAVDPSRAQTASGLLGDVERTQLSEVEMRTIVARERDELLSDADHMRSLGRPEADELAAKAAILDAHLLP